ncbi:uncharacterized protein TRUGW13939_03590 [Talaromyces rugulosus]|uniref:Prokaryotic-type class I peptide chain release factors domain-containing protein n=1 Tax=Talaromyces rugulosus TaxID=121627 RepID=A0A7H8QSN5_TALRU|nr:uncharacterized protein TRUGW13939_03590 [Talaromyces rugulosus]QKX56485.1 hypothetical protein TRUGW13939_03590 [Talaromyces rugulosus]
MGSVFTPWRPCLSTSHAALIRPLRFSVSKRGFGNNASEPNEEELKKARQWLKTFSTSTIPRDIGVMTYSRSSGPGGQNVNKLNSKATLQVPLKHLHPILPRILHQDLQNSRYMAERSNSLVINSDESRKRSDNMESCYVKLYTLIQTIAKTTIPGETSQYQIDRVKGLKHAENESRLKHKKLKSSKKSSRRGSKYDE